MSDRSIVLSFHETLLHQSDIDLLAGPHWLNDTAISFYFEYLQRVTFVSSNDLLFVSPEVTQCIKMVSAEEIGIFLDPLKIKRKKFVFFALNDNDSPETAGGTHWSLLIYSQPERSFYHLDSSSGSNRDVAQHFSTHLTPYLFRTGSISLVNKPCAQQTNSYDCGVHVAINAEMVAQHVRSYCNVSSCNTQVSVSCSAKRREILNIIQHLATKA